MQTDAAAFIRSQTVLAHAPLVPEIALHLASEITPIWQATEAWLAQNNVAPPYWAFAWPGGQALARHMLDRPHLVAGRHVLDFAAGCGIAAIAGARAGAGSVTAAEIDHLALAAIALNASANGVVVAGLADDLPKYHANGPHANGPHANGPWDLIVCGDVCYEAPMTRHILPWLRAMARTCEIWIADPGRAYLPTAGLVSLATYDVPTSLELEARSQARVTLYQLSDTS